MNAGGLTISTQTKIPTSPHWYTPESLERLAAYVSNGHETRTVRDFISEFRGLKGTAKQQAILAKAKIARVTLADLCENHRLDRPTISALLRAMQQASTPVPPRRLGLIGKEHLAARFTVAKMDPKTFRYQKALDILNGLPRVLEVAFAYCPELDRDDQGARRRLVTAVNWSPGIRNPFRQLGEAGESLDTVLAVARVDRSDPVILVVHIACPQVRYTDRGKSSVVLD